MSFVNPFWKAGVISFQNRSEIVIFPGIPRLPNHDPTPGVANASPVPYAACEGRSVQYCTTIHIGRESYRPALSDSSRLIVSERSRLHQLPCLEHNIPVSYTHLRAHETPEHLVCRL